MNYYPGCITQVIENDIEVSVMHKSEGNFKWPEKEDKIFYNLDDVLKIIDLEDSLSLMKTLNFKRKW